MDGIEGIDLHSTGEITKFLRNKDTSVSLIYEFVTSKLFTDSNIYLPNKENFVLELIISRISLSNNLSATFKYSAYTWELFNFIWTKCNNDQSLSIMRLKTISKLKFGEVFSKLLNDINEKKLYEDIKYIDSLSLSIQYIIKYSNNKLHISDDQNLSIIKNLLNFVIIGGSNYSNDLKIRILSLVYDIFMINNRYPLKYDTKHKSEFSLHCLGNVIISIREISNDSQMVVKNLQKMIKMVLFNDNNDTNTIDNNSNILKYMEKFCSSSDNSLLNELDIVYLLEIIINKIDIIELEKIVKLLTNSFPQYSSILLKKITEMNKSLSFDFLSSLVSKALELSNEESYKLIIYAIKRNSDVAIKYTDDIIKLCSIESPEYYSLTLSLFKELIDSYSNNREIETFINLWNKIVNEDPYSNSNIFKSDEIIDYVSNKLIKLSNLQLTKLLNSQYELFKSSIDNYPVFLISLCKGLLKGNSGSVQNSLSKSLIITLHELKPILIDLLKINGKFTWKLKFYILTLFDVEEIENDIINEIENNKIVKEDYFFYTILRIIEQKDDIDDVNKEFKKSLVSYYRKSSSLEFKFIIFTRWFLVIENILDRENIGKIVKNCINSISDDQFITILNHKLIQTQSNIMYQIIENLISNELSKLKFFQYISVYALNKSQREGVLNLCLNHLSESYTITIIKNLLQLPTFKSKIECEFDSLLKLANFDELKYNEIIKIIFKIHLQQPVESIKYLNNIQKELNNKFNSLTEKNCGNKKPYLIIASILIKETENNKKFDENKRSELINTFTSNIYKLLLTSLNNDKKMNVQVIKNLIEFLSEVGIQNDSQNNDYKQISTIISKIGLLYSSDDEEMKLLLFKYICSLYEFYEPNYVFALYVVLNNDKLYEFVNNYIINISQRDNYQYTLISVCESIKIVDNMEDLKRYIEIITSLINNLNKPSNEGIKIIHRLFIYSISTIFTKFQSLNYQFKDIAPLLECLKNITSSKIWLFTQYSMELVIALISNLSDNLIKISTNDTIIGNFINICQIISSFILYQRHRLTNRHHIINNIFISLMKNVFKLSNELKIEGSQSFERLVGNLCEPNTQNILTISNGGSTKDSDINNSLLQIKSGLRKYLPILICNYIKFYLQYQINIIIKPSLDNVIYKMIDLLTLNELNFINKVLDQQSRVVFKNIYEDYKKFYKWKDE